MNLVVFAAFQAAFGTDFAAGIGNVIDNIICILFAYWTNHTLSLIHILHCGFNAAANAGEDTPYYSPYQRAIFAVMQGWTWVYGVVVTVCVFCAVRCV